MLDTVQNQTLTMTGPGTPLGDVFRRYWHPVALSNEVTPGGKPKQLRIMGEDLVLFRDDDGRPGLLGLRCSHRLTSLAYGRVEDGGIRCPFHGWLYDITGRCLQQPGEPEESSFKDKIRHPAYPCRELGGLIFAFMGPADKRTPLPSFEALVRGDGTRLADSYVINSNWLQNLEGALDPIHSVYLHMDKWSEVKDIVFAQPKVDVSLRVAEFGIWRRSYGSRPYKTEILPSYGHFIMPTGFIGIRRDGVREGVTYKHQSWYTPIDDERCIKFTVAFTPKSATGGAEIDYGISKEGYVAPGPENDYFRDYDAVDTISGIPVRAHLKTAVKGLLAQDSMANETQGAIVDRTKEHLAATDLLLIMTRKLLQRAVEDVRDGREPQFSNPQPDDEGLVRVNGDDPFELR